MGVWGAEVCLGGRSDGLPGLHPCNTGFYLVSCVNFHSCTENTETRSNLTCPYPVLVVKITTTQQVHTVPAVAQWMCHTNPFRSTRYAAICSNILGRLGNTEFRCFCEISHSRDSKLTFPTSQEMGCPSNESHRTTDSLGWKEAPQVLYSRPA